LASTEPFEVELGVPAWWRDDVIRLLSSDEDEGADKDMESEYVPPPPLPEEFSGDDGRGSFGSSSRKPSRPCKNGGSGSSDADDGFREDSNGVIDGESAAER
jgi:hypothetical protein